MFKRVIATLICVIFSCSNIRSAGAQDFSVNQLPVPGTMVGESAPFVPLALKGLVVNLQKPLEFQFIVDTGKGPQDTATIKDQASQLVKYFLAGLTIPEGDLWVNLSPYEKNKKMVPPALGQTDLGRDLLAQDYILKQLTASLIYPEKDLGKEFWNKVYAKAQQQFGTTNVPVSTFNKVWILPDQAQVFENVNAAYVTKSTLKVMLDEDYLALQKHVAPRNGTDSMGSQIVREIVIPEITKEVNTGKNFAPLRQIYQALILAKWYKETIQNGLLEAIYTNKNKIAGVNLNDPAVKEQIYERYLKAYKKGAFNYIKEVRTPEGQVVSRKYFSGGTEMAMTVQKTHDSNAMITAKKLVAGTLLLLTYILGPAAIPVLAQSNAPIQQTLPAQTQMPPSMGKEYNFTFGILKVAPVEAVHPGSNARGYRGWISHQFKIQTSKYKKLIITREDIIEFLKTYKDEKIPDYQNLLNYLNNNLHANFIVIFEHDPKGDYFIVEVISPPKKMARAEGSFFQRSDAAMTIKLFKNLEQKETIRQEAYRKIFAEFPLPDSLTVQWKHNDQTSSLILFPLDNGNMYVIGKKRGMLHPGDSVVVISHLGVESMKKTRTSKVLENEVRRVTREINGDLTFYSRKSAASDTVVKIFNTFSHYVHTVEAIDPEENLGNPDFEETRTWGIHYTPVLRHYPSPSGGFYTFEMQQHFDGFRPGTTIFRARLGNKKETANEFFRAPRLSSVIRIISTWGALALFSEVRRRNIIRVLDEIWNEAMSTPNPKQNKPDAAMNVDHATLAKNGGIDFNQINVNRRGKTVSVQFDHAQLVQLEQGGFEGFTPVMTGFQYIKSPFPLLGINVPKQEVQLAKA